MWSFPGGSDSKEPPATQETWFTPSAGKIPWRRAWQPTPGFLTGESHGQKSLGARVHRVADLFSSCDRRLFSSCDRQGLFSDCHTYPAEQLSMGMSMWGLIWEGRFEHLPGLSLTWGNLN